MKRQVIKGYPWPEEKYSIAIRKAVIDDGMYLIVDFVSDKPQLRVCIGKKEYANYYPEGTSVTVQGKKHETYVVLPDSWDQKQIAKVIESDLLVKQAVSYDDGGTGVEKENLCGWIGLKEHDCQQKLTGSEETGFRSFRHWCRRSHPDFSDGRENSVRNICLLMSRSDGENRRLGSAPTAGRSP